MIGHLGQMLAITIVLIVLALAVLVIWFVGGVKRAANRNDNER